MYLVSDGPIFLNLCIEIGNQGRFIRPMRDVLMFFILMPRLRAPLVVEWAKFQLHEVNLYLFSTTYIIQELNGEMIEA